MVSFVFHLEIIMTLLSQPPTWSRTLVEIALIGLMFFSFGKVKAQSLCDDPCPPGPLFWQTITLCTQKNLSPPYDQGPAVFVTIAYRIRTCNGVSSIIIDNYVVVDSRNTLSGFQTNPPCNYPIPMSTIDLEQAAKDAIAILLGQLGNPAQGNYEIYYKGSCNSLVKLSYPAGAFIVGAPDDLGQSQIFRIPTGSTVAVWIPCDDACCKVTYNWQLITTSNGETTWKWLPISYNSDGADCASQPLPDYNSFPNKLEAQLPDGSTSTGTVVSQEPCQPHCPRFVAPPPPSPLTSVKTDLSKQEENIQLTASPIPFNNFIQLSSNKPILKVVVYDMKGKKVLNTTKLENGELNTSELKEGIYFIQLHFENNIVKSLKVVK